MPKLKGYPNPTPKPNKPPKKKPKKPPKQIGERMPKKDIKKYLAKDKEGSVRSKNAHSGAIAGIALDTYNRKPPKQQPVKLRTY